MQLMYRGLRGRPDVLTVVSFLSTRVQEPDEDDYKKLARVIRYLRGTTDLVLRLSGDASKSLQWWVDASYAIHPDLKSQTCATMSMGKGSIYSQSCKQKLLSRSSTKAKLIGVYDVSPQMIWTRHFLEAQGFAIQDNVLYQDNKSAKLLDENGRASSSKRTKHIHIRYFFYQGPYRQQGNSYRLLSH
jgi:hypothetical protein